jgi:hypothetical protein
MRGLAWRGRRLSADSDRGAIGLARLSAARPGSAIRESSSRYCTWVTCTHFFSLLAPSVVDMCITMVRQSRRAQHAAVITPDRPATRAPPRERQAATVRRSWSCRQLRHRTPGAGCGIPASRSLRHTSPTQQLQSGPVIGCPMRPARRDDRAHGAVARRGHAVGVRGVRMANAERECLARRVAARRIRAGGRLPNPAGRIRSGGTAKAGCRLEHRRRRELRLRIPHGAEH